MKPPQGPAGPGNVQALEPGRRPGSKRWTLRPLSCSASPYRDHRCDIRVDNLRGRTRRTRGRAPFDRRPPTRSAAKEGCRRATCRVRMRGATVGTEVQVNAAAFSECDSMAPSSSRIAQRSDTLRDQLKPIALLENERPITGVGGKRNISSTSTTPRLSRVLLTASENNTHVSAIHSSLHSSLGSRHGDRQPTTHRAQWAQGTEGNSEVARGCQVPVPIGPSLLGPGGRCLFPVFDWGQAQAHSCPHPDVSPDLSYQSTT